MRIALCLYGKRRDFDKCKPAWNKFKAAYAPDVFYHGWGSDDVSGTLNGTNTKAIMISQDIDFSHLHLGINQYTSSAVNILPQTYSIMHSDRLRMEYEELMGFKYDWVIRSRFDISLHTPTDIPFHTLDHNHYHVCANHWPGDNGMYDDNLMLGNSEQMTWISSQLFGYAKAQIQGYRVIPSGEQLLSNYIKTRTTTIHKTSHLNFTLGRNL
jgi:hypothetical protein